jgi:uncharacterized protein YlxP (DUF503 family)
MANPSDYREPSLGHSFTVGVLHLDLRLPACQSLKEKRGRLARIMNHLRKTHPVVLAEVGDQDVWGRAGVAAVTLSPSRDVATRVLEAVAETVERDGDIELLWHEIEFR